MTTSYVKNSQFTLFLQGQNEAGEIIPKGQYKVRLNNRGNPHIFHRNYSYNHHRLVNRKYCMECTGVVLQEILDPVKCPYHEKLMVL